MNKNHIFVYGTLKSSSWNHGLIQHCKKLCDHTVIGFELLENKIPFMIRTNNPEDRVRGEIYECDDRTVESMDRLEGHPDWYRREIVSRIPLNGLPVEVQGYTYISFISPQARHAKKDQEGVYYF